MYVCTYILHTYAYIHTYITYICICIWWKELTIKCTRAARCNFLTKHSWAYSLQQCSSLSLRYKYRSRQLMCWAKIGQFNIHGRRRSIKLPGLARDRSCRVSEKSPDDSTRRTAAPLATITVRTPTKRSRRLWSRVEIQEGKPG